MPPHLQGIAPTAPDPQYQDPLDYRLREKLTGIRPPHPVSISGMVKDAGLGFLNLADAARGERDVTFKDMLSVPMLGGAGGLLRTALSPAAGGTLGSFGGKLARNYPHEMDEAFKLGEKLKMSPEELWDSSGLARFPDQKLRFEFSDEDMRFQPVAQRWIDAVTSGDIPSFEPFSTRLDDLISHQNLFENYPDFRKMPVQMRNGPFGWAGYMQEHAGDPFYPKGMGLSVFGPRKGVDPPTRGQLLGTVAHEAQHGIQEVEDFARGAAPDTYKSSRNPYDSYLRTAGEVESRLTQKRRAFTDFMRRKNSPTSQGWGGMDFDPAQQIVRGMRQGRNDTLAANPAPMSLLEALAARQRGSDAERAKAFAEEQARSAAMADWI